MGGNDKGLIVYQDVQQYDSKVALKQASTKESSWISLTVNFSEKYYRLA